MPVVKIPQCKVCNSKFRNIIENLHVKGMSPEKIHEYLQSLSNQEEKIIVEQEDIKPSAIRRHMQRHFNIKDETNLQITETKNKIIESRNAYNQGIQIAIDKVNAVSYMIESAMIKMEQVEELGMPKEEHKLTIQYMNSIKGLIETLAKLTGDLKQEGTIDVNFFSTEITKFADIVLSTIRKIDEQLNLDHKIEYAFAQEFSIQWKAYEELQQAKINGLVDINEGNKMLNVNTFNET